MSRTLDFDDGFTSETVSTIVPVAAEDVSVTPAGNITSTDVQAALEEIQADVDSRATSSALSTHVADTANPHAVTKSQVGLGNVDNTSDLNKPVSTAQQTALDLKQDAATAVTLTGTQALTNKDYDGGIASNTSRITLPKAAKTTLDALTRKAGTIVFDTTTNKPYYDDGSTLQIVGSGSGGNVNFIANGDAEAGTTGWSAYVDAAGSSPVDGTGGSSTNFNLSVTSTTPLAGNSSFLLNKINSASAQGEGVSYDFIIDKAYLGKVLKINFDYIVDSGTFVAGTSSSNSDLTVWIYDRDNAVLIQPSAFKLLSNSTTVPDRFEAEFQASLGNEYRLIIHNSTTSTANFTLYLDNVSVSPNEYVFGSPVSDWASYTPTYTGFGTVTTSEIQWRIVGDSLELRGNFTTGVGTAVEARMSLPTGLVTADTTKIPSLQLADGGMGRASAAGTYFNDSVLIEPSVAYVTFGVQSSTQNKLAKANGNTLAQSQKVSLSTKGIPIAGASSSVQMADQTSTRVVAASVFSTATVAQNTTTMILPSVSFDTHAAYNAATGVYTVPVSGIYQLELTGVFSGTANSYYNIYRNGTFFSLIAFSNSFVGSGALKISCNAGDTLTLGSNGNMQSTGATAGTLQPRLSLARISGPSQIASSETVAASYFASANRTGTAAAPFNFDSVEFDTHNAVTTGASWRFTAPISGIYKVSSNMVSGTSVYVHIFKNGTIFKVLSLTGAGASIFNTGTSNVALNSGDYIELRPTSSATITGGALSGNGTATISIERIGNRG